MVAQTGSLSVTREILVVRAKFWSALASEARPRFGFPQSGLRPKTKALGLVLRRATPNRGRPSAGRDSIGRARQFRNPAAFHSATPQSASLRYELSYPPLPGAPPSQMNLARLAVMS